MKGTLHLAVALAGVLLAIGPTPTVAQDMRPNIILMNSDDYGWPYYSFMIEKLRHELQGRDTSACSSPWTSETCEDNFSPGDGAAGNYRCAAGQPPDASCQLYVATPNLDALAAGGVAFERGYVSESACQPAYESMLTGLNRRDLTEDVDIGCNVGGTGVKTLPEVLTSAGYNTFLQGKSWLGNPTDEANFNDKVCDTDDTEHDPTTCDDDDPSLQSSPNDTIGEDQPMTILKQFIKRQDARGAGSEGRRPFFVMWSPLSPHYSYNNHPPHIDGMYGTPGNPGVETINPPNITSTNFGNDSFREYLEAITYYDERIGELVEFLRMLEQEENCEPNPLYDASLAQEPGYGVPLCASAAGNTNGRYDGFRSNTLIIYVTDNGAGTQQSKGAFSENGLRTPIILNYPDAIPARGVDASGRVVTSPALVGSIDILPTVMEYATPSAPRVFPDAMSLKTIAENPPANPADYPSGWRRYFFSNSSDGATAPVAVLDSVMASYTDGGTKQAQFKVYADGYVNNTYSSLKRIANVTVDPFEEIWAAKDSLFVTSSNLCKVKYGSQSAIQHLRGVLRSWDRCGELVPGGAPVCRDWVVKQKRAVEACGGSPAAPPVGCAYPAATPLCMDPAPDTATFNPDICS